MSIGSSFQKTLDIMELIDHDVSFLYKNYKEEVSTRKVKIKSLKLGSSEWHKDKQWLLVGFDLEKKAIRFFAVKDILSYITKIQSTNI